nr:acyltransferase [Alistipes ihumii]
MPQTEIPAAAFADTKPHYNLLDGLRGVAALTVVCFHLFEAYATSHLDQKINHGYLAVDFFFILSGFVVGSVILAYLCLKLYDEPVRRFLTKRFLNITKRP